MSSKLEKGTSFELQVGVALSSLSDCGILFNTRVHSHSLNDTTEIDIILLTEWGNLCLEAKSFTHGLVGSINDRYWVGRTWLTYTHIVNPIIQNATHTRALMRAIYGRTKQMVHFDSIIVVPDTCVVETDVNNVMTLSKLVKFIEHNNKRAKKSNDPSGTYKIIEKVRK